MTEVTMYKTAKLVTSNTTIALMDFAKWVMQGYPDKEVMQTVQAVRTEIDKAKRTMLKAKLPVVSISCTLNGSHGIQNFGKHSGFIAIDIDADGIPVEKTPAQLRDELMGIAYVAFSALSVSGAGVFAIIPLKNPTLETHKLYFQQLTADFASIGVKLDISKSNPNALRYYSYDPDAKIKTKDQVKVYDRLPIVQEYVRPVVSKSIAHDEESTKYYINEVISRRLNILEDYHDWYRLAWALIDGLGEILAKDVFVVISSFSSKFKQSVVEQKFDKLIKAGGSDITFGSFIYAAKQAGVPKYEPQPINVRLTTRTHKGGAVTVDEYGNYFRGDKGYPDDWDFHLPDYTPLTDQQKANAIPITTK